MLLSNIFVKLKNTRFFFKQSNENTEGVTTFSNSKMIHHTLIKPFFFIIPNIRCRYTSQQTVLICNENAPQHTDIMWKGLLQQTHTWKWTAVEIFAINRISNSSSNNSSNNDHNSINNSNDSTNYESQSRNIHLSKGMRDEGRTGFLNAARQTTEEEKKYKKRSRLLLK